MGELSLHERGLQGLFPVRMVVPGVTERAKWVSWDQILVHSASICIGFVAQPVEVGCCSVKWLVRNPQIYPHDCPNSWPRLWRATRRATASGSGATTRPSHLLPTGTTWTGMRVGGWLSCWDSSWLGKQLLLRHAIAALH